MKAFCKRGISLMLVMALLLCMSIQGYAAENYVLKERSSVKVVQDNNDVLSKQIQEEDIRYDYKISEPNENGICDAVLTFEIPEICERIQVSGELEKVKDSEGKAFWMGPLEGMATIDGTEYQVLVGITKDLETGKMNAGVSMTSSGSIDEQIMFAFGDRIDRKVESQEEPEQQNAIRPHAFSTVATTTAVLKNTNKTGVTAYGSFEKSSSRFKVKLKSHIKEVKSYYMGIRTDVKDVAISKYTIGMKRKGTSAHSYIAGIEEVSGKNGCSGVLKSIFSDLLSLAGIPTSTIDAMLGTAKGSIAVTQTTTHACVETKVSTGNSVNFDANYFPVIFQLQRASGTTSAKAQDYEFYASIQYHLTGYIPQKGTVSFYSDTNNAAKTISVTV